MMREWNHNGITRSHEVRPTHGTQFDHSVIKTEALEWAKLFCGFNLTFANWRQRLFWVPNEDALSRSLGLTWSL